jgi:hypothetical protein
VSGQIALAVLRQDRRARCDAPGTAQAPRQPRRPEASWCVPMTCGTESLMKVFARAAVRRTGPPRRDGADPRGRQLWHLPPAPAEQLSQQSHGTAGFTATRALSASAVADRHRGCPRQQEDLRGRRLAPPPGQAPENAGTAERGAAPPRSTVRKIRRSGPAARLTAFRGAISARGHRRRGERYSKPGREFVPAGARTVAVRFTVHPLRMTPVVDVGRASPLRCGPASPPPENLRVQQPRTYPPGPFGDRGHSLVEGKVTAVPSAAPSKVWPSIRA